MGQTSLFGAKPRITKEEVRHIDKKPVNSSYKLLLALKVHDIIGRMEGRLDKAFEILSRNRDDSLS
jgi:hypothetical protein